MLKITPNTAQPAETILQINETIAIGPPPFPGPGDDRSAPEFRERTAFFPALPSGTEIAYHQYNKLRQSSQEELWFFVPLSMINNESGRPGVTGRPFLLGRAGRGTRLSGSFRRSRVLRRGGRRCGRRRGGGRGRRGQPPACPRQSPGRLGRRSR